MNRPQTKLAALVLAVLLSARGAYGLAIESGFDANTLGRTDDLTTGAISLGFTVNFLGQHYSSLFVNNNGNVTFDTALAAYTPFDLASTRRVIVAPFFADVDTRGAASGLTHYGSGSFDGHAAFGVTWDGVGYFGYGTDKLNAFQLLLVDRQDIHPGDFDIYFNYDQVQWEAGNASGGRRGVGGFAARAGYSNGEEKNSYELTGSATQGAFLDGGANSLVAGSNIGQAGRYLFQIRNGVASVPDGGDAITTLALAFAVLLAAQRASPKFMDRSIPRELA